MKKLLILLSLFIITLSANSQSWWQMCSGGASWSYRMMQSFVSINAPYVTYTQAEKDTILLRLSSDYIVSTFGPAGLNKTICDFFMIFWNSNTSTNLTTRTNTKTGATLRWNYGQGHIYSQNNLPANITNGVVSVSSTDGFSTWTRLDISANTFIGKFCLGSIPSNIAIFYIATNLLVSDVTSKIWPTSLTNIALHENLLTGNFNNTTWNSGFVSGSFQLNNFSGNFGNITSHATNGLLFRAYSTGFTTNSSTTYRKGMTEFRLDGNALPTAEVNELLHNMNVYYTANVPTANCTINLSGATMGIPTDGANNTDALALSAIWVAAGKTLTLTVHVP